METWCSVHTVHNVGQYYTFIHVFVHKLNGNQRERSPEELIFINFVHTQCYELPTPKWRSWWKRGYTYVLFWPWNPSMIYCSKSALFGMAWGLGVLQETKFYIWVLIHSLKTLYDFERNKSFLRTVPIKKKYFCHVLWLCGESRLLQGLLESKKEIGGNHALIFFLR